MCTLSRQPSAPGPSTLQHLNIFLGFLKIALHSEKNSDKIMGPFLDMDYIAAPNISGYQNGGLEAHHIAETCPDPRNMSYVILEVVPQGKKTQFQWFRV